ncbi:HAD-IA family hydrolase [Streptacidiphilus anmyonensis]|uniref:HAD-IA family hydrolase n=1 Tax=Streptacidiphilus anmyonensis TaxID=405782 RepID=UPI0005A7A32C|nr:HAD-IA family hydrolase [Streptacidiphilus anmyonensis]
MSQPPIYLDARALLLDMDGTLVDSGAVVLRVWGRWAAEHGLAMERVEEVVHGRQGHESMAILLPDRPVAENIADNAAMLAAETADLDGIVPIPGAPAFLAAIATAPHALVTSADVALATARMSAAGLRMPDVRVTAEDVSASKPDPEGFLKGAAELGFEPADCVVFEDSEAGVAAGLAAGMRVVGIGASTAAYGATVTVATLDQVAVDHRPDGTLTLHITG